MAQSAEAWTDGTEPAKLSGAWAGGEFATDGRKRMTHGERHGRSKYLKTKVYLIEKRWEAW